MTTPQPRPEKRPRDVRLDVFRGLCLIIIFISHLWDNPWAQFIPARFGFSDATEIFVFCSGMASAIAFGSAFRNHGFAIGAARVLFRCWQVYWAHIGVLLVAAATMIFVDTRLGTTGTNASYVDGIGLAPLFGSQARQALMGLLTLTWVPHYFDILPMYLVILMMLPIVVCLHDINRFAAMLLVILVWSLAQAGVLWLPGEPWGKEQWFFNPFGWQLVFFSGFALMSGWVPAPTVDRRRIWIACGILAASVPLCWWPFVDNVAVLAGARDALGGLIDKSRFGLVRYVHFLALAYVAWVAAGEGGRHLTGPLADMLRRLGQQSLAIFMTGLVLSFSASAVLNLTGRGALVASLVNVAGIAILFGVARLTAWFKAQPWQKRPAPRGRLPTVVKTERTSDVAPTDARPLQT